MSKKPRITLTERDSQTDLDVLLADPRYKARMDNPFGQPSMPVAMKDANRECRWFNAAIQTDHIWRNKRKGWDQVRPDELADLEQIGGYTLSPDGYVTRGERGQEILMSMPKPVRRAIQATKTQWNNRNVANAGALKNELVNAAGNHYGDEAANYVQTHVDLREDLERRERVDAPE